MKNNKTSESITNQIARLMKYLDSCEEQFFSEDQNKQFEYK